MCLTHKRNQPLITPYLWHIKASWLYKMDNFCAIKKVYNYLLFALYYDFTLVPTKSLLGKVDLHLQGLENLIFTYNYVRFK